MYCDVISAEALEWPLVSVRFADGRQGVFDFSPYLQLEGLARLRDPGFFSLAKADHGTVSWPFDVDFPPERIYEECAVPGDGQRQEMLEGEPWAPCDEGRPGPKGQRGRSSDGRLRDGCEGIGGASKGRGA